MQQPFIVVIEVDNVRAAQAYAKGVANLEAAMPEILFHAERYDTIRHNEAVEASAKKQKAMDEYFRLMEEHDEAEEAHAKWRKASAWSRGEEPVRTTRPSHPYVLYNLYDRHDRLYTSAANNYKSQLDRLKDRANLAVLAVSSFRMTEHDVKQMLAFEDGSAVVNLLESSKKLDTI